MNQEHGLNVTLPFETDGTVPKRHPQCRTIARAKKNDIGPYKDLRIPIMDIGAHLSKAYDGPYIPTIQAKIPALAGGGTVKPLLH